MATVIGRTKSIKLAMFDALFRFFFLNPEFETKFQKELPLFLEIPEFSYNAEYENLKEASGQKASSIRPSILIEHRFVTDERTDTGS